jgi:hypothetical protein
MLSWSEGSGPNSRSDVRALSRRSRYLIQEYEQDIDGRLAFRRWREGPSRKIR